MTNTMKNRVPRLTKEQEVLYKKFIKLRIPKSQRSQVHSYTGIARVNFYNQFVARDNLLQPIEKPEQNQPGQPDIVKDDTGEKAIEKPEQNQPGQPDIVKDDTGEKPKEIKYDLTPEQQKEFDRLKSKESLEAALNYREHMFRRNNTSVATRRRSTSDSYVKVRTKKIKYSFYISEEDLIALEKRSRYSDLSVSQHIREAIKASLGR